MAAHTIHIRHIDRFDEKLVGKSLVETGELAHTGFPVPPGFVVTKPTFNFFLRHNGIFSKFYDILEERDLASGPSLLKTSQTLQALIKGAHIPEGVAREVREGYSTIGQGHVLVNGVQVKGDASVLEEVKLAWARNFAAKNLNGLVETPAVLVQVSLSFDTRGEILTDELAVNVYKGKLTRDEEREIKDLGLALRSHFYFPQVSEWGISRGKPYLLSTRPASGRHLEDAPHNVGEKVRDYVFREQPRKTATKIYINLEDNELDPAEDLMDGVLNVYRSPRQEDRVEMEDNIKYHIVERIGAISELMAPRPVLFRLSQGLSDGELEALSLARNKNHNVWAMLPNVVRTSELEVALKRVKNTLDTSNTFKIWLTLGSPSNLWELPEFFSLGIDGVSICVDPLSEVLGQGLDWALQNAVVSCQYHSVPVLVYGDRVSQSDELLERLVLLGVTGVAVHPHAISRVRDTVANTEQAMIK